MCENNYARYKQKQLFTSESVNSVDIIPTTIHLHFGEQELNIALPAVVKVKPKPGFQYSPNICQLGLPTSGWLRRWLFCKTWHIKTFDGEVGDRIPVAYLLFIRRKISCGWNKPQTGYSYDYFFKLN